MQISGHNNKKQAEIKSKQTAREKAVRLRDVLSIVKGADYSSRLISSKLSRENSSSL